MSASSRRRRTTASTTPPATSPAGRLVHVHRKLYLPTYGLFDEGRDVGAGDALRAFENGFGRAGILICEDAWHPTTAWLLAQQGAEVLFVLGNGPTRGAREGRGITSLNVWRDLLRVTAQFQTSWVVYVNRVGVEDGLSFGGGSAVVDPFGRVTAESPSRSTRTCRSSPSKTRCCVAPGPPTPSSATGTWSSSTVS